MSQSVWMVTSPRVVPLTYVLLRFPVRHDKRLPKAKLPTRHSTEIKDTTQESPVPEMTKLEKIEELIARLPREGVRPESYIPTTEQKPCPYLCLPGGSPRPSQRSPLHWSTRTWDQSQRCARPSRSCRRILPCRGPWDRLLTQEHLVRERWSCLVTTGRGHPRRTSLRCSWWPNQMHGQRRRPGF